ncbi:MAG: circadian clock protein KaiC [Deltaproteobacteria bacterium]|nr:circadian clock protein KaiC [Deltaproteobacteria bacterium]
MRRSRVGQTSRGRARKRRPSGISKVPTGISGLDEITEGGLPRGRTTLVCGGPGCGKTLLAMEFVINGAIQFGEPGVVIAFEETTDELAANVASLGFDLEDLIARELISVDAIALDRSEHHHVGDFDLGGLFVRIGHAIDSIGAKRVVLDTLEALFVSFDNELVLRAELRRLFRWLKDRGVTAVITGEQGNGTFTRYGLEEYVSDCVIALDNRVVDQISTRRLRIVKYRGSTHGTNEYPFLIDKQGLSVLPVTSLGLDYPVSTERVPTGVTALDGLLSGGGYFRGSSVLVSGTAGTGKSSLAAMFADASCRRGERVLYFALEEPGAQIVRNMSSIGLDLAKWQAKKRLVIRAERPTVYGLEMHLLRMHQAIEAFAPHAVIVDPVSSLVTSGDRREVKSMLVRLFDYLKGKQITTLVTSLTSSEGLEETTLGISSLIDSWFQVRDIEIAGERTRGLSLVKSRGMGHSNQIREFLISSSGIDLVPVAVGPSGVLTGSARINLESERLASTLAMELELDRRERHLERKRKVLAAQVEALHAAHAAEEEDTRAGIREAHERAQRLSEGSALASQLRSAPRKKAET